jgi:hypothetical protein
MAWGKTLSLTVVAIVLALLSTIGSALAQPAPSPATTSSAAPSTPSEPSAGESPKENKAEAEARYYQGRKLYAEGALDAALAEFVASRELYPRGKTATSAAARCLMDLKRFDHALELFEILLRDFADSLKGDQKLEAQRAVVELRGRVGTIDITGAEVGAAIVIDSRSRGDFPAPALLRVASGSHIVRVFKEGFEPSPTS